MAFALLILVVATAFLCRFSGKIAAVKRLYPCVQRECERFNVDESLVFSVIDAESGYDKKAVSEKGAIGLMQLMPETAKYMAYRLGMPIATDDLFNEEINVALGTAYLAYLNTIFGKKTLVIAAFNAGEGNVSNWLKEGIISENFPKIADIPFYETRRYTQKVLRLMRLYEFLLPILQ